MATSIVNEFVAECARTGARPPRCLLHQLETHAMYVEVIRIRRVTLTPEVTGVLARFLPLLPNLERIDLEDCLMSYVALEPLCDAIASLRNSHPCFELKIHGLAMGPRTKSLLRQLYLAHSGITIVINGEEENFPSRMQSFRSMRRPETPPSSDSLNSQRDDDHVAAMVSDEPVEALTEEELLEQRIAGQLARLCGPVKDLHLARHAAAVAELVSVEEAKRLNLEEEEAAAEESLRAAAAFETPFKPPEFNPEGPLCSPLRLRRQLADPMDQLEAETQALKERLFLLEDALTVCQDKAMAKQGLPPLVTVDGRALRRHRMQAGETAAAVAARFNVSVVDLEVANKEGGIPDAEGFVLVPMSLDALLLEQLVAERAQAIRATNAVQALTDLRSARGEPPSDEVMAACQQFAVEQVDELHARSTAREETQAKIRSIEMAVYEHKRDSWLRFLKYTRLLSDECDAWYMSQLDAFDESLHVLRRQFFAEQKDIREAELRRQISPEEHELRSLKRRCHGIEQRLAHAGETGSPVRCM